MKNNSKIKANKTLIRLFATIVTKKAIMLETIPSQKTSDNFNNLYISDY